MEPLSLDRAMILKSNAAVPSEYVDWLQRYGWGSVASDRYTLYDGVIALEEIVPDAPAGFLTFGDDMAGSNGCFSVNGDGVVYEYVSDTSDVRSTGKQFTDYIKSYA